MTSPYSYLMGRKADPLLVYAAWGALIWVLGLAPAARVLASGRTFTANNYASTQLEEGVWTDLVVTLLVLGLGGGALLLGLALRGGSLPKAGLGLWLGAMAFAFSILLSSRFGQQPYFSPALFGLPIVLTAVYLLPPVPLSWFVKQVKKILLFYAYGSLLAALVAPRFAVQYPYTKGLIPGFDIRLHGLASHANGLAPFCLTYLILNWFSPSRTRWDRLHQVVVLLALILSQSKTIWGLLLPAYMIYLAYVVWSLAGLKRYTALAFLGAIFSGGMLYLTTGPAWLKSVGDFLFSGEQGEQLTTLTGRTLIWQVTLSLWEQNPWFGYGLELWSGQMGLAYAPIIGFAAADAHNQVYQSLGEAGIIGVAGLFLYSMTLLVYGIRYVRATNAVALTLVSVLLLWGITESVFIWGAGNSKFFVQFLIFVFLMLSSRQKSMLDEEYVETHKARRLPALARGDPPAAKQTTGRT